MRVVFAASASVFPHRSNSILDAQKTVTGYVNREMRLHPHTLSSSRPPLVGVVFILFVCCSGGQIEGLELITFFMVVTKYLTRSKLEGPVLAYSLRGYSPSCFGWVSLQGPL